MLFKKKDFKKRVLQTDPLVLIWETPEPRESIVEIQDANYSWTDEVLNTILDKAEDWVLTAKKPLIPQIVLAGKPFQFMQTSMIFQGTDKKSKVLFLAEVAKFAQEGKLLVERNSGEVEKDLADLKKPKKKKEMPKK